MNKVAQAAESQGDRIAPSTSVQVRPGAGVWARSWLFTAAFVLWTSVTSLAFLPSLLQRRWTIAAIRLWIGGIMFLARTVAGVRCRIEGRENLPAGPCIIAAQHQSAFETYLLFTLLDRPVFILKREMIGIPIIGWYIKRAGLVDIDRNAGGAALRRTLRFAKAALARGEQVVIFPQGTTVPPGVWRQYRSGVAALYLHCDAPVIPVALNSDHCWGKIRVLKRPGAITIRFLPALSKGLGKDEVLDVLRERIEAAARTMPGWPEIQSTGK
jgi:1-acyl-sn-glycerol-3-phosphate acyltransferase